jgi:hypothetical protein
MVEATVRLWVRREVEERVAALTAPMPKRSPPTGTRPQSSQAPSMILPPQKAQAAVMA